MTTPYCPFSFNAEERRYNNCTDDCKLSISGECALKLCAIVLGMVAEQTAPDATAEGEEPSRER